MAEYFIKTTSSKLEDVKETYPESLFIHTHDENGDDNLYIGDDRVTDNLNIGDTPLTVPTVGIGSLQTSNISDLKDRSISEIIIDMVKAPVVTPTPSILNSVIISYSDDILIEFGSELPKKGDIECIVDPGIWSDGTPYAGEYSEPNLVMDPDKWNSSSEEGEYVISAIVTFAGGGTPKDNYSKEYPEKQYLGGSVTSNQIKITSVKPIYINDVTISTMTPYLKNYLTGEEFEVIIPAEVESPTAYKFKIGVPEEFRTMVVKQYNPLTAKYDIPIPMTFVNGNNPYYEREDNTYTNTLQTKYKINLKK